MEAFRVHSGLVAPLDRANVDTDLIIPNQFLKSIKRTGFGPTCSMSSGIWTHLTKLRQAQLASQTQSFRSTCQSMRALPSFLAERISVVDQAESMRCGRSSSSGFAVSSRRASLIFSRTMRSKWPVTARVR